MPLHHVDPPPCPTTTVGEWKSCRSRRRLAADAAKKDPDAMHLPPGTSIAVQDDNGDAVELSPLDVRDIVVAAVTRWGREQVMTLLGRALRRG